jgi:hypothetical protein
MTQYEPDWIPVAEWIRLLMARLSCTPDEALRETNVAGMDGKLRARENWEDLAAPAEALESPMWRSEWRYAEFGESGELRFYKHDPTQQPGLPSRDTRGLVLYRPSLNELWPAKDNKMPRVENASKGGRPRKPDWDEFYIEVIRQAEINEISAKRTWLHKHMLQWAEDKWGGASESVIRERIRQIFEVTGFQE